MMDMGSAKTKMQLNLYTPQKLNTYIYRYILKKMVWKMYQFPVMAIFGHPSVDVSVPFVCDVEKWSLMAWLLFRQNQWEKYRKILP